MSPSLKRVLEEALDLSPADRAELAGQLIESLDPEIEKNVEEAWDAEIARRLRDVDAGTAKTIPWAQVQQELKAIVDARRPR